MDINSAQSAIESILASIPDEELPPFDRVETNRDGKPVVWWGGQGRVLGSATNKGQRDPSIYRSEASWSAILLEMTYRADLRLHENGDDPTGVPLARNARSN